jgi:hypothetical protein
MKRVLVATVVGLVLIWGRPVAASPIQLFELTGVVTQGGHTGGVDVSIGAAVTGFFEISTVQPGPGQPGYPSYFVDGVWAFSAGNLTVSGANDQMAFYESDLLFPSLSDDSGFTSTFGYVFTTLGFQGAGLRSMLGFGGQPGGPLRITGRWSPDYYAGTTGFFQADVTATEVPEPATLLLLSTGLIGLRLRGRSRLTTKSTDGD